MSGGRLFGGVPHYQHVERLGSAEVAGLLDGPVEVQTKIDGANLSVWEDPEKGLVIASRQKVVSIGGEPATGFRGAVEYVLNHRGIRELLKEKPECILRGEWLVKHTVAYAEDSYNRFYVFDVQWWGGSYVPYDRYREWLLNHGVSPIESIELDRPSIAILQAMLPGPDEFGAVQKEGLVVKRYDFKNEWGRTVWGKLVNEQPARVKRMVAPAEVEEALAGLVTDHLVAKVVQEVAALHDEAPSIRHTGEVIGRVWHTLVQEELWDFQLKRHGPTVDFKVAQKLVGRATRDLALAIYNGGV